MKVKLLQSCLTLSDPIDSSLPGSSAHGIFQARVLEWAAIAFSRELGWVQSKAQKEREMNSAVRKPQIQVGR